MQCTVYPLLKNLCNSGCSMCYMGCVVGGIIKLILLLYPGLLFVHCSKHGACAVLNQQCICMIKDLLGIHARAHWFWLRVCCTLFSDGVVQCSFAWVACMAAHSWSGGYQLYSYVSDRVIVTVPRSMAGFDKARACCLPSACNLKWWAAPQPWALLPARD